MKQEIRHRRLHAFYTSKVLNSLMIVVVLSLLQMNYDRLLILAAVCGTTALLLFIAYSLWLWIKKPESIVISNRLSDANGIYLLYYLIITAVQPSNKWWYIAPIAAAVILLFATMIYDTDKKFEINVD